VFRVPVECVSEGEGDRDDTPELAVRRRALRRVVLRACVYSFAGITAIGFAAEQCGVPTGVNWIVEGVAALAIGFALRPGWRRLCIGMVAPRSGVGDG
jgi:hypothetical protein